MKTYSFEILKHIRAIIVALLYIIFVFALIPITAIYAPQLSNLSIFLFLGLLIFPIIYYKKLLPIVYEKVTLKENGFYIESQARFIEWGNIKWYKIDSTSSPINDILEFGIKNEEKISFTFYKKSQKENDWVEFKSEIIRLININCNGLRNYYDSKVFKIIFHVIIISWILLPIQLVLFDVDIIKIFALTFTFFGSTVPLFLAIKSNRDKKLK